MKRSSRSRLLWTPWMGLGGVAIAATVYGIISSIGWAGQRPRPIGPGAQRDRAGDRSADSSGAREQEPSRLTMLLWALRPCTQIARSV